MRLPILNYDLPEGTAKYQLHGPEEYIGGPEVGEEIVVISANGRRVTGYVIEAVHLVWAPRFIRDRFRLKLMTVPIDQIQGPEWTAQRYGRGNQDETKVRY